MINKNFAFKLFAILSMLCLPALALAVTQKEMEQARTIAAKAYIRYANDGSGYLDAISPTTMADLEAQLKPKEKENIKAFKAIPVPTDYKDWNKEKLVEYWAVTAFQDKGLLEKGRGGRLRARTQINKMTIAPPQPEPTPAPAVPAASTAEASSDSTAGGAGQNNLVPTPSAQLNADEDDLFGDENDLNVNKESNYTWVYIMVLAILVAIVVALVVYASKVMAKPGYNGEDHRHADEEEEEQREQYESRIADKDTEISSLKKKLENATRQNADLKAKVDALTAELTTLKYSGQPRHTPSATVAEPSRRELSPEQPVVAPAPTPQRNGLRSIFLGRANARGIFVRADRTLNVGNSVFVLETSDGFSGSFKVADSPAAWSLALSNPREYLETACTGHDLDDTSSASRIVTESAGTAVFEGGCWKVARKARIRYEA